MSKHNLEITPQFIVDHTGKKTGVLLDMLTFDQIMEKLEEFYLRCAAQYELDNQPEFSSFQEAKKRFIPGVEKDEN